MEMKTVSTDKTAWWNNDHVRTV